MAFWIVTVQTFPIVFLCYKYIKKMLEIKISDFSQQSDI